MVPALVLARYTNRFAGRDKSGQSSGTRTLMKHLQARPVKCKNCHEIDDVLLTLGPTTSQLNINVEREGQKINQLKWLALQGKT